MSATVDTDGPVFSAGVPRALFSADVMFGDHGPGVTIDIPYDVTADGRRFLINERAGTDDAAPQSPTLTVVLNWMAALNR